MTGHRAVVVGGGLAGTSAAIALADRGWQVTLLESRARLGGAAYSFRRGDLTVDTGQHVILRCYTGYRELLDRMGVGALVPVQERMDIPVLGPGGRLIRLRRATHAPAPFHLLPALARYSLLSPAERVRAAAAAAALRRVDPTDPGVDEIRLGAWLREHGQGRRAIEQLWGMLVEAALNVSVEEASLALAAQVFRVGLLDQASSGDVGVPAVPLSELHDAAARRVLDRLGVRTVTRSRVRDVVRAGGELQVRTSDGATSADAVVVALPPGPAAGLVPPEACPDRSRWKDLGGSPIVNVHVRYDRPVTRLPFAATVGSVVPWFFDRTDAAFGDRGSDGRGQYLVVSISAAAAEVGRPADDIVADQLAGLAQLLPAAADATVLEAFVTREPRATFHQRAGTAALRPRPVTAVPGLVLAGAWTATGWPDTLEGAVRSGAAAAAALGAPVSATLRHDTVGAP